MVFLAIFFGILVGSLPFANQIATLALIIAMTVSISNISFKVINFKGEVKNVFMAMNDFYAYFCK